MNRQKAANITNLTLGSIMSKEDILKAYFGHDKEAIIKAIATNVKDADKMLKTLESANYEIANDKLLSKTSSYGDIQKTIVEQLIKPSNVEFLETNIINNEEVLGDACPNLGTAHEIIIDMKQQTKGIEMTR